MARMSLTELAMREAVRTFVRSNVWISVSDARRGKKQGEPPQGGGCGCLVLLAFIGFVILLIAGIIGNNLGESTSAPPVPARPQQSPGLPEHLPTKPNVRKIEISPATPRSSPQKQEQAPLPEPEKPVSEPDWNARYEEIYSAYRDRFISPKIGDQVALQLASGRKVSGIIVEQNESRLGLKMDSGTVVRFENTQLDIRSRVALFRDDYATLHARRQVKTDQGQR